MKTPHSKLSTALTHILFYSRRTLSTWCTYRNCPQYACRIQYPIITSGRIAYIITCKILSLWTTFRCHTRTAKSTKPSSATTFISVYCLLHVSAFVKSHQQAIKNHKQTWVKCNPLKRYIFGELRNQLYKTGVLYTETTLRSIFYIKILKLFPLLRVWKWKFNIEVRLAG